MNEQRMPRLPNDAHYRRIHRCDGSTIGRALDAIPPYRAALDSIRAIDAHRVKIPAEAAHVAAEEIAARLRDTGQLPDDLTEIVARAVAEEHAGRAQQVALHRVRDDLAASLDAIVAANLTPLCAALDAELQEVQEAYGAIDGGPITDAQTAINQGRVEEYEATRRIEAQYTRIRGEQLALYVDRITPGMSMWLPNVEVVWPDYVEWKRRGGRVLNPETQQLRIVHAPWPDSDQAAAGPFTLAMSLRWASATGVRLWVPTPQQRDREDTRINRLIYGEGIRLSRTTARPKKAAR